MSGWGINLMGALIAIILTSLVGGLIGMLTGAGFGMMDIVLCAVSVLVFMLFTAYDTQKLKYYYAYYGGDASMLHKSLHHRRTQPVPGLYQHLPVYRPHRGPFPPQRLIGFDNLKKGRCSARGSAPFCCASRVDKKGQNGL